jgi:hypothetical protein
VLIPRVQKKLDDARTDNEKDRYIALIEEYEKYSNPRTPESQIYNKTAANIVRQLAQRSRIDDDAMEDLMQDMAVDFFKPLRAGGNDLTENISRFDEDGGPLALNKYWMSIVDFRTKYHIRQNQRHFREKTIQRRENDEGVELDPMAQVEAPSHIDESQIREAIRDLVNYIHSKVRNPLLVDMFNLWFELAQEKGANKVDMKNDVYVQLREHGHAESDSMMNSKWFDLRRIIVSFFEKELGDEYVPRIKKVLHLSVAESLTHKMYRRRLAAWMLGGIFRGIVFAKE